MVPPHATQLALSAEERAAYRRLADALLQTALREYAAFRVDNPARRVSPIDWKLVKAQDGVAVYKERHPPSTRKDAPRFVPRLLTADGRVERVDAHISVPQMLVTGTMRGAVEDALHGAFVDGPETHAARGYYIRDRSTDFRVLARLEEPSDADPHRFCGIAWTEMGGAGVPFVKRRDLLTLVASGMAALPSGERVAYYLIHSVSHPQLPALAEHKLLRAKCSFSYLFSQQQHQGGSGFAGSQVETYQKGFFAPLGDVPERGVVSAVVRTLISPSRLVDAGNNRKLCFMLKHAPPGREARAKSRAGSHDSGSFHGDADEGSDDDDDSAGCAGGCSRRRSDSFFSSSGGAPFSSSGGTLRKLTQSHQSHGVCVICKLKVCAACKVVKKLAVDATGYELEIKSLGFCLVCVNKAKMLSAPALARQELLEKHARMESPSVSKAPSRPPVTPSPVPIERKHIAHVPSPAPVQRERVAHTPNGNARSPLVEKPRLQRKTSWIGSGASATASATSSPSISRDGRHVATTRPPAMEKPAIPRKTSWIGGDAASKTSLSSDEGSGTYVRRGTIERPQFQRTVSWSGVGAPPTTSSGTTSAVANGAVTRTRPPPPPPPTRRSQFLSAGSISLGEEKPRPISSTDSTPRKRTPPPERPLFPIRQPVGTAPVGPAPGPIRSERRGASPTGGIYLLPTQDQQQHVAAATQARRRIDERVAIEDIALKGILL